MAPLEILVDGQEVTAQSAGQPSSSTNDTGLIVGIVLPFSVVLLALLAAFWLTQRKRTKEGYPVSEVLGEGLLGKADTRSESKTCCGGPVTKEI